MAGTENGYRHERRRFITRHDVEDAAAAGQPIQLRGRDVLTDEAAIRAADLGVSVQRDQSSRVGSASVSSSSPPSSPSSPSSAPSRDELRRAVRAAVVAELGSEPPGLDAALDRVLKQRSG
jgi:hypothetical protein